MARASDRAKLEETNLRKQVIIVANLRSWRRRHRCRDGLSFAAFRFQSTGLSSELLAISREASPGFDADPESGANLDQGGIKLVPMR